MVDTIWLHRASADGGIVYVCFRSCKEDVELVEGYLLPPQMPLIKSLLLMMEL